MLGGYYCLSDDIFVARDDMMKCNAHTPSHPSTADEA